MVHVFGVRRTRLCATQLRHVLHVCMYGKVESMPPSDNEIYMFRYDTIRYDTGSYTRIRIK
jgi:hypothetical protein